MAKNGVEVHNELISREIIGLTHRFGNLLLHISGEGKVDYRNAMGTSNAWLGMIKTVISGDIGCMVPYEGYDNCALDNALDILYNLEPAPHLNSSAYEEYVPSPEHWRKFVDSIKEKQKDLTPSLYLPKYTYHLYSEEDPKVITTTVILEPLCNTFVVGEYNAATKCEFVGVLEDYDQPKIDSCFVMVDGKELELQLGRLIHYRHRKYMPRKGDYLIRDNEKDIYIILPQEDYSIH